MKKYCLTLICILSVLFSFTSVFAFNVTSYLDDDYFETKFFDDDLLEVVSYQPNEKNVIVFDDNINVSGIANDLTILFGNKINSNTIGGYAFEAGQALNFDGSTNKDAFLVGNEININATIGRDAYVGGKNVTLSGAIVGDLYVFANKLTIDSTGFVQGNIYANGVKNIIISDNAIINGAINYNSDAYTDIPNRFKTLVTEVDLDEDFSRPSIEFEVTKIISNMVTPIVTFSIMLLLFPLLFTGISSKYKAGNPKHILRTFGIGLLVLILPLLITTILLLTLVGAPIAIIIFLLYIILLLLAKVTAGFAFTKIAFNGKIKNSWISGFIGIIILEILYLIPLVGVFLKIIALVFGLGLLFEIISKRPPKAPNKEKSVDAEIQEAKSDIPTEKLEEEANLTTESPTEVIEETEIVEETEVKEPDEIIEESKENNKE